MGTPIFNNVFRYSTKFYTPWFEGWSTCHSPKSSDE